MLGPAAARVTADANIKAEPPIHKTLDDAATMCSRQLHIRSPRGSIHLKHMSPC